MLGYTQVALGPGVVPQMRGHWDILPKTYKEMVAVDQARRPRRAQPEMSARGKVPWLGFVVHQVTRVLPGATSQGWRQLVLVTLGRGSGARVSAQQCPEAPGDSGSGLET